MNKAKLLATVFTVAALSFTSAQAGLFDKVKAKSKAQSEQDVQKARPGDQQGRPDDQQGRPGDQQGRPGDQQGRDGGQQRVSN